MPSERVQSRIDALLDEADAALAAGDWQAAKERAGVALGFDPNNAEARAFLDAAEQGVASSASSNREVVTNDKPPTDESPLVSSDSPSSFASGRYTISKLLGEGGKKRVYQAHDTLLDRDVAFALIKDRGTR